MDVGATVVLRLFETLLDVQTWWREFCVFDVLEFVCFEADGGIG